MEEREKWKPPAQGGRRGPFIGPPRKLAVARHLPRSLWPWGMESPAPSLRAWVTKSPNPLQRRAPLQKLRRPESPDPRAGVSGLGKVPGGSGPKLRTKMTKTHFWAGVSGPPRLESPALEKAEIAETKMTITWASELRCWWSWARWNHNNECYKSMHRNIIVQPRRVKTNEKRFDLSIKMNR
jgi:hypothetical protein